MKDNLDYLLHASDYVCNENYYDDVEDYFLKKGKGLLGGKLKKVAGKIKAGVKKAAGALGELGAWALLMPFQLAIIGALKAKKLKVPKSTKDRGQLFYKTFINKNYDEAIENAVGAAISVGAIVNAVIDYIKNVKKRKEEGGKLDPADSALIEGAEKSADQIVGAAEIDLQSDEQKAARSYRSETGEPQSDGENNNKMYLILGAAVVLFLVLKNK